MPTKCGSSCYCHCLYSGPSGLLSAYCHGPPTGLPASTISLPFVFHSQQNYHPERISWLHHQTEVDKIKSKHLSFVGYNFVFQFHFLLLPHHVCFAYRTLNFFLSLEYARNFHKALSNTNGKGNLCKLEKGALFSSSFIAVYLKSVLINMKIFSDHDASNLGSAQLVQSCVASCIFLIF